MNKGPRPCSDGRLIQSLPLTVFTSASLQYHVISWEMVSRSLETVSRLAWEEA